MSCDTRTGSDSSRYARPATSSARAGRGSSTRICRSERTRRSIFRKRSVPSLVPSTATREASGRASTSAAMAMPRASAIARRCTASRQASSFPVARSWRSSVACSTPSGDVAALETE